MTWTQRANKTLIPLLLLPILVLLGTGNVMLYRFFRNQVSDEIRKEKRALDSLVYRTCIREYQRIYLVIQSLGQVKTETREDLRNSLESMKVLFGPEGEFSGILKGIAYTDPENLPHWTYAASSPAAFPPVQPQERELQPGEMMFFPVKGDSPLQDRFFLRYKPADREESLIQLEIDWPGFSERYIEPAVAEALEGYELVWKNLSETDGRETGPLPEESSRIEEGPPPEEFRFRPLPALLNSSYNGEEDHTVPLPMPLFTRNSFLLSDTGIPEQEPGDPRRNLLLRLERGHAGESARVLSIGYENLPFYKQIEKRNAINWLQSMVILLGTGLLFLIILVQTVRLRHLREKEQEFVASMTHELRTPLTVIRSAADNLAQGVIPPEKVNRYGSLIGDQALRLGRMVEEILLFSSMEGRPASSEPVTMDLHQLIREIRVGADPMAEQRGISLRWETEGLAPSCLGDPEVFRLSLENLLMNAFHHAYPAEPGPVRIMIRPGIPDHLQVTVEDEGRGIAGGEQKKVFSPFYRDRFSRQNQEKGSGLGLFICSKKAAASGGSLTLESPYKKIDGTKQTGCRFVLKLPCRFHHEDGKPWRAY